MLKKIILLMLFTVSLFAFFGCETNTGDSAVRQVDINIAGHYRAENEDATIVDVCSGSCPYYLNLTQTGDEIEAFDDHGLVYSGTIGSVNSETESCTFILKGTSVAGAEVTMNGTIQVDGNSATMEGSWIEPSLYGVIYAIATVPNQPSNSVSISATSTSLSSGNSSTLTATGGSGSYPSWSLATPSYGTLNTTSGSSVTYTAAQVTNSVTQVITVTDSAGTGASISIRQTE